MLEREIQQDEEKYDYSRYSSPLYNVSSQLTSPTCLLKSQFRGPRFHSTRSLKSVKKISSNREVTQMLLLRNLIKKFRIQKMVSNFCSKIKRNITKSKPVEISIIQNHDNENSLIKWLSTTEGLTISNTISLLFLIINTTMALILSIIYSLELVFPQIQEHTVLKWLQIGGIIVFLCQIFIAFITKHYKKGKLLIYVKEIALDYLASGFCLDLLVVISISAYLTSACMSVECRLFRLIMLVKLWQKIQKNDLLETAFITSFYREQYFGLVTVVMTNICFAHVMSLCLNAMALINTTDNWLIQHQIAEAPWHIRYIWGVYWGTTIMLTVGFGDFAATTHLQALCLTFIEMVSCISLSYNINCVGNILNNIKSEKLEKKKNLRILSKMIRENHIDQELENRLNNYVQEAFEIRREFSVQEQEKLLESIPKAMKRDYLKNMADRVFLQIPFLTGLTSKGRSYLAEGVFRAVTHPEQIILKRSAEAELLILNKGQLGLCIKNKVNLKGIAVEKLTVKEGEKSKLVSLDFIKSKRIPYFIKSLSYSIVYSIDKENLVKCLKQTKTDYEIYCSLRDKSTVYLREYELYKCLNCLNEYHTKFDCPKLHYIPYQFQVINKHLQSLKICKQETRIKIKRKRTRFAHVLTIYESQLKGLSDIIEGAPSQKQRRNCDRFILSRVQSLLEDIQTFDPILTKSETSRTSQISLTSQKTQVVQYTKKCFEELLISHQLGSGCLTEEPYDLMCNWNYYFPECNPSRLRDLKF